MKLERTETNRSTNDDFPTAASPVDRDQECSCRRGRFKRVTYDGDDGVGEGRNQSAQTTE